MIETVGDQDAALSAVGVVELIHGIHRADAPDRRADAAKLAGKLDAEQQKRGVVIPFADLIGATALSPGYSALPTSTET